MSYDTLGVPDYYRCVTCDAHGVKLWRQYQSVDPELRCAACACCNQNKVDDVDEAGTRSSATAHPRDNCRTDQIGWYVPAVPDPSLAPTRAWWGYTSVPPEGVRWWKSLPTRRAP